MPADRYRRPPGPSAAPQSAAGPARCRRAAAPHPRHCPECRFFHLRGERRQDGDFQRRL